MVNPHWIRNTLRNKFQATLIGKVFKNLSNRSQPDTICFVAATRSSESEFWTSSPLGLGLKPHLGDLGIQIDVKFSNSDGLPKVYNDALRKNTNADIFVFLHDDIWLEDRHFIEKIRFSMKRFDVVGVAGNTRISRNQPAWAFRAIEGSQFIWDHGHLSGSVRHGAPGQNEATSYGMTPAPCELMDGVFLAGKRKLLLGSNVSFDERFKFHFYDMDFCRTARRAGLSLGTWPIDILHLSGGAFGSPSWWEGYTHYLKKWKH